MIEKRRVAKKKRSVFGTLVVFWWKGQALRHAFPTFFWLVAQQVGCMWGGGPAQRSARGHGTALTTHAAHGPYLSSS